MRSGLLILRRITLPAKAFGNRCLLGQINGYGRTGTGFLTAVVNHIFGRFLLPYILSGMRLGITGIWDAMAIAFIAAFLTANVLNHSLTKEMKRKAQPRCSRNVFSFRE